MSFPNIPSEADEMKTYQGKCHCGKVIFDFEHAPITIAARCNCSICVNRGYVFVYPLASKLKFVKGSLDDLTVYWFGRKENPHYFCPTCGSGLLENGFKKYGVNLRCVEGINFDQLEYEAVDGASW